MVGHDQSPRTHQCQSVVEPSPSLIETLVRNSQPLELLRQQLASVRSQKAVIHLVQLLRVRVDLPDLVVLLLGEVHAQLGLHARGSLAPPRRRALASILGRGLWHGQVRGVVVPSHVGKRGVEGIVGGRGGVGGVSAQTRRQGTGTGARPLDGRSAGLEGHIDGQLTGWLPVNMENVVGDVMVDPGE